MTDVVTGAPLANVTVSIPNTSVPDALTDADGRYRLPGIRAGKCYVEFSTKDGRYAYEYYPDAPIMLLAQEIDVPAGGEVTGIDAALAPGGRITGRVTDAATGRPLAGVRAVARYADDRYPWWKDAREAITDAVGRYVIEGLWTSIFQVEFTDEAGHHARTRYANGADVGVLVGEETAGIDAAMTYEGSITGRVTDEATGAPLVDATVTVYGGDAYDDAPFDVIRTDSHGRYVARGLAAGPYLLRFAAEGYAAVFYGGGDDDWGAPRVEVRVAEITTGIDQALTALGGIHGRVTDAGTGAPLAGIEAYLDGSSDYSTGGGVPTAANGTYAFANVHPGEHRVFLRDPKAAYRDAYAKGADGSETIIVQAGKTTDEVNAALLPAAAMTRKITGAVTDSLTGQPIPGIRVALYDCYQ